MKDIAVLTDSRHRIAVGQTIMESIYDVFGELVSVNLYFFSELEDGDLLNESVVITMMEDRAILARKYVRDPKQILIAQRTIKSIEVYKIFQIPKGAKVLVVNDDKKTTIQMIALLYQIGVNHLNLIPYYNGEEDKSIKIAITPGESSYVPDYIENIIDVGNRCLDAYTITRIMDMLNIESRLVIERLAKYLDEVIDINKGIKTQYLDLYIKNEQFNKAIQHSSEGVLITNNEYRIVYYNDKFAELLDLNRNVVNEKLKDLVDEETYNFFLRGNIKQELLILKDEYALVTKSDLVYFGETSEYCFNFNTVTHIRQMEHNVGNHLRKRGLAARYSYSDIVYKSIAMKNCIDISKKVADSYATLLLIGESGTGKELIAQSMHNYSNRANKPFVAINCAALPESLLESELFGYDKGAFTGARKDGKLGLFEQAEMGTLFLDEIGDMTINLQTRFLRVLQEKQIMRIGSDKIIDINVRIIAATNKDLNVLIKEGRFREDLYYRVNTFSIKIPPLRERKEDILELFKYFVGPKYNLLQECDKKRLLEYSWPGNVRELQNAANYFVLMDELNEGLFAISDEKEYDLSDYNPYIFNQTENENESIDLAVINRYINNDDLISLLEVIYKYSLSQNGIGRFRLLKIFENQKTNINESRLRKALKALVEGGYLDNYIGRQGSKINDKGILLLNYLKKSRYRNGI